MEALVLYQKGHYRESLAAYERLRRANEQSDLTPMHRLYSMIGLNHARLGNFREAFDNTREAYLLQDSLFTHTVQQELSDLTVRYRTQEKELEIARLRQAEAEQQSRTMKRTAAFSAALSGLMLLVILLLYLRRRQKRRTEELERLDREREREFADFRRDTDLRLARKYIDGLESERERLARELHDGACNDLLGIGMLLEESLPAGEPLARIRTLLEKSRANLRHVSHALMPPVFRYAALDEMLEDYIAHAPHPASLRIVFRRTDGFDWSRIPEKTAYELYRIVQEALGNVVRHARATEVEVTLEAAGGRFTLTVSDNGRGFDASVPHEGVGLRTVRDRVRSFGGVCELRATPSGTRLVVTGDTAC